MFNKLEKYDIQKLESYWSNKKLLYKELKFREDELITLGTTPSQSKNILMNDRKYQHIKTVIETIEDIYSTLDDDTKQIVDMRYKQDHNTWEDIAEELFMKKTKALRIRDKLLTKTAQLIGWL